MKQFFTALSLTLSAVATIFAAGNAAGQSFPTKPVRVIVPYAPGGSLDIVTRMLATRMTDRLGQPVIVENRAGASGTIGTLAMVRSPADGYTLAVANLPAVSSVFVKNPPHDTDKDFSPVAGMYQTIYVLAVNGKLPARNFKEFLEYAKANPGKMNYAASFVTAQLPMIMLMNNAGVDLVGIQYKGSAPGMQALMTNEVQAAFDLPGTLQPLIKNGDARIIAVTSERRLPQLPDVPTTAELGFPRVRAGGTVGIWAPAGTPSNITTQLGAAVIESLKSPDIVARIAADASLQASLPPDELMARYRSERASWAEAAKAANFTPE